MSDYMTLIMLTGLMVALGVCLVLWRAFGRSNSLDVLIWWPVILYIPGPLAIFGLFSDHPVFSNYFSDESVFWATIILVIGFLLYIIFVSKSVRWHLSAELKLLPRSDLIASTSLPLVILGIGCMGVQIALMCQTGASLLSGQYVLANGNFSDNSTLFNLTAGLYEIFSAVFAFRMIGRRLSIRRDGLFVAFSLAVLALRILGGTRLIALKIAFFILIVKLLQGAISLRKGAAIAGVLLVLLIVIGSLRGSGVDEGSNLLFLLFSEPALGSLSATYVVDYYLSQGVYISATGLVNLFTYLIFIAIHLIPGFIYDALGGGITLLGDWGYYRSWAAPFYPFRQILDATGLETISPVGGQSIVALGVALFGVVGAVTIIPLIYGIFAIIRRYLPNSIPFMLIIAFEAPSVFRDSTEILCKQIFVIAVGYWGLSLMTKFMRASTLRTELAKSP